MKIPEDAEIPESKLTAYLLVPRTVDDKSAFLGQAGFGPSNWVLLRDELLRLIVRAEAIVDRRDVYGTFYRVEGTLAGPAGQKLEVVSIWLCGSLDGRYRFITLKPNRRPRP
jgi:hypothetical protein